MTPAEIEAETHRCFDAVRADASLANFNAAHQALVRFAMAAPDRFKGHGLDAVILRSWLAYLQGGLAQFAGSPHALTYFARARAEHARAEQILESETPKA